MWEMAQEWSPEEREVLYLKAAAYFEKMHDTVIAVRCYDLCGRHKKVVQLLERHAHENPWHGHFKELEPYYLAIPEEEAEESPDLMMGLAMVAFLRADFDVSRSWYEKVCAYTERPELTSEEQKQLAADILYLDIACIIRTSEAVGHLMQIVAKAMEEGELDHSGFSFSVTSGLPSIINGGRDFSDWTLDDAALYRKLAEPVERALGADGVCLPDCAIAESAFLRGEDVRARMLGIASKIQDIYLHGTADVEFAATGLLAKTQVVFGSAQDARQTILKIREGFLKRGEDFFIPNIDAMLARIDLKIGNVSSWERWYRDKAPKELLRPNTMDRYIYLTLAAVELARDCPSQALVVLSPWRRIFEHMDHTIDLITLDTLTAICIARIEQEGGAGEAARDERGWEAPLGKALASAAKYSFVQPIATFGIAVLPLLQDTVWDEDPKFLSQVTSAARRQATFYPAFLQPPVRLERPLTPTEEKVLRLIAADMSNAAIGEILDIKLPTVKAHVSHIMQKLGVTTRAKAKAAAKKLGLI